MTVVVHPGAPRRFFTADTHFGHGSIIGHAGRPFSTVEEMDDQLVRRWNRTVGRTDVVYVLGDLLWRASVDYGDNLLGALNGVKHLVRGNHDTWGRRFERHFAWIKDLAEVRVPDEDAPGGLRRLVLCHYALRTWNRSHYGSWHLHGHSHGTLWDDPCLLSLDVGVDCWGYRPVSYEEVKARMSQKTFRPVDHHGQGEEA